MIESPLLERLFTERDVRTKRQALEQFIEGRFGTIPNDIAAAIEGVSNLRTLDELIKSSSRCNDLESFRTHLSQSHSERSP